MTPFRSCRRWFDTTSLLICLVMWIFIIYMLLYHGKEVVTTPTWRFADSKGETRKSKPLIEPQAPNDTCKPQRGLVFARTPSRQGDTLATVLQRYGYHNQLSFVMGADSDVISREETFHRTMARKMPPPIDSTDKTRGYDILTSYVRYNHREINATVPKAAHITLLVEPVNHLLYVFNSYNVEESLHLKRYKNPLEKFMDTPQAYVDKRFKYWYQMHNGQMYSLGFDNEHHGNRSKIAEKVESLQKDLDFVLLAEYFDESLVVLRKKLCWLWEDMLYLPLLGEAQGIKKKSYLKPSLAANIAKWNVADVTLYEHFNRSLREEISRYGPSFQDDLQYFRKLRESSRNDCLVADNSRWPISFRLKEGARAYCPELAQSEEELWRLIRNRQQSAGKRGVK